MEPNPIILEFKVNQREGKGLISYLIQPGGSMVVFPHKDHLEFMDKPRWYMVTVSFPPNGRVGIATPVKNKTLLDVSLDMTENFLGS